MAHLNRDFPRDVAQGCQAIAARRSEVVTLASGFEEVNQRWAHARRTYAAGLAIRSADAMAEVAALWEEARGRVHTFRFRDWGDFKSCLPSGTPSPVDQTIGTGDGATADFRIVKTYGSALPYVRPILLPKASSLRVALDGAETASGWSLSATGGVLSFAVPPGPGVAVTAGFTFDVPVRFEADSMIVEWTYFNDLSGVASAPDVSLIEVRAV
ncbi:DUF2460 domain-containing protein [Tropicimonas sp. IMCC34043]|uniref:DUF2460 domain-containing protein n=1 Tax=Tropicimonas sp. IMCC34043 TaxID=2248760 RepID=UPI0013003939|nr:DUF2460 domain-containing protein [Tropicimonas sp. IMCC34043]